MLQRESHISATRSNIATDVQKSVEPEVSTPYKSPKVIVTAKEINDTASLSKSIKFLNPEQSKKSSNSCRHFKSSVCPAVLRYIKCIQAQNEELKNIVSRDSVKEIRTDLRNTSIADIEEVIKSENLISENTVPFHTATDRPLSGKSEKESQVSVQLVLKEPLEVCPSFSITLISNTSENTAETYHTATTHSQIFSPGVVCGKSICGRESQDSFETKSSVKESSSNVTSSKTDTILVSKITDPVISSGSIEEAKSVCHKPLFCKRPRYPSLIIGRTTVFAPSTSVHASSFFEKETCNCLHPELSVRKKEIKQENTKIPGPVDSSLSIKPREGKRCTGSKCGISL